MALAKKVSCLKKKCFEGNLTMPKVILLLIGIICILAGIVYGMCIAPVTDGIAIGSNNHRHSGCMWF